MSAIKIVLFFIIGVGIGVAVFALLLIMPIPFNNPILSYLGIKKPVIVAFLPYYLASRATNNYNSSITTLTYFGVTLDNTGHVIKLAKPTEEEPGWHDLQTTAIQKQLTDAKNHDIILSLAVIGQTEEDIAKMIEEPRQSAQNALTDIVPLMKKYNFTDLNIDIESFKLVDNKARQQYTIFVKTITDAMQKQRITVTVDVAPIAFIHSTILDPVAIGKIADYMFVMGYDYHTVVSSNTGPIAPLNGAGIDMEYDVAKTIAIARKEIDQQKIILGLPLYGYEWDSLSSEGGAATVPNSGQTASNRRITDKFISSCSTCNIQKDVLAEESDYVYQDKKGDPYFHQTFLLNQDDLQKRITYTTNNQLAGVGLWALGYESSTLLNPLKVYKQSFSLQ